MAVPLITVAAATILELGKLGLQYYFTSMRILNKTPEEVDELFKEEYEEFCKNVPNNLPDV